MHTDHLITLQETDRSFTWIWWVAALVFAVAFFGASHDLFTSAHLPTADDFDVELDELTSAGSNLRRVSYSLLGACGLLLLMIPSVRPLRPVSAFVLLLTAYVGFCGLSVCWSDDPSLTIRRIPILVFCFLAVLGVAKHFTPRDICWLIFAVTGGYLVLGIGAEVALGMFRPLAGDYRFSGTIHPNTQGIHCSLLALAGLTLLRRATRGRWLLAAAVGLAIMFLLLTKSRTSCAAFAVAVWCLYFFRLRGHAKPLAVFSTLFAVGMVALAILFASDHFVSQVHDAALLGRTDGAATFSGRIPLWREILRYVEHRPWLGYGYGAFWNVERVQAFVITQGWQISHAHSGLFEPLANVGLIGVMLLGSLVAVGVLQAFRRQAATHDEVYAFLLAQAAFAAVTSIGDAYYVIPSFCATVCVCAFASMAMTPREQPARRNGPPQVAPAEIERLVHA